MTGIVFVNLFLLLQSRRNILLTDGSNPSVLQLCPSLILLVIEAGIDIDMTVMKLVGTRGLMIAVVGSFLPIGVGVLIAWIIKVEDWKAIIASGAVFGPTSLGIALNVLKGGKIWYYGCNKACL